MWRSLRMGDLREQVALQTLLGIEELLDPQTVQFRHRGARFLLRADGVQVFPELHSQT